MIDETKIIHTQVYDDEHEDWLDKEMTIAEFLDAYTIEGCPKVQPCDAADRNYILQKQQEYCDANCPYSKKQREFMCSSCMMGDAIEMVEDAPSVTPARVKCADCKRYSNGNTNGKCNWHGGFNPPENWYCADFERR